MNIYESFPPIALPTPPVFRNISEYKGIQGIIFPFHKFPPCLPGLLQGREAVNQAQPALTQGMGRALETRQLLIIGSPNIAAPRTKCADSSGARQ